MFAASLHSDCMYWLAAMGRLWVFIDGPRQSRLESLLNMSALDDKLYERLTHGGILAATIKPRVQKLGTAVMADLRPDL